MSIAEDVIEKLSALPPEKQEQVLHFVESLTQRPAKPMLKDTDPHPWLKVAMGMKLEGPPDWSERFEDYLDEGAGETVTRFRARG